MSHFRESISIGRCDGLTLLGQFVGVHEERLAFVGPFEFFGGCVAFDGEEVVVGFILGGGGEEGAAAAEEEGDVEAHCFWRCAFSSFLWMLDCFVLLGSAAAWI